MAEKHKKIVLTVKQKLKLLETFENGEIVTKLAKNYEVRTELLHS
jgi:non-homologous end joining protein Ku